MFRFLSIILLAAIVAAGYLFLSPDTLLDFTKSEDSLTDSQSKSNELDTKTTQPTPSTTANATIDTQTAQPVTNQTDETTKLELAPLSGEEKQQAQEHVENITYKSETPIEIKSADHFVTIDQLLELPAVKPVIVKIENTDAVIVSAQNKQNTKLNVVAENAKNAEAAQSFAVNMPSLKSSASSESQNSNDKATTTETLAPTSSSNVEPVGTSNLAGTAKINSLNPETDTVENISLTKSTTLASTSVETTNTSQAVVSVTPARTFSVKSNPVDSSSLSTNILSESESASIIRTLKKNIEELSTVKVTELKEFVTGEKPALKQQAAISTSTNNSELDNTLVTATETLAPAAKINPVVEKLKQSPKKHIKLKELLSDIDTTENRIFYLHAVNPTDEQGIWGIIQKGLMGTFSKGILLPQANGTVKALIPEDADEILSSKKSSFLGRLLNNKVLTTYVYNYEQGNIGKNPDYIKPGQQLIIVTFTENELMNVYQHFKNKQF